MDLDFAKQSYNISCDHITKLNNKYKSENDLLYNKQFECIDKNNYDDSDINNNRKNIKYLNSMYITNKSCIFKSTEPDNLEWTSVFNHNNNSLMNDDNALALFNENTRQKILTRY
jgi:hypothetical protein